tara:strand:- start:691 stop:1581 length:891 start_codon:yes stop_codon:yes gene_type:complete
MIPKKINIYEVGPRDGLQNEKHIIPIQIKTEFVNKLSACNFKYIEVGSFVSSKWVPQMADSAKLYRSIKKKNKINYSFLTPNLKGLEEAISQKVKTICVFTTASESFSKKNTNCSVKDSLKRAEEISKIALSNNIKVRGYLSCVLGCPYEGKVDFKKTADLAVELINMGCYEISLGDTIGTGNPKDAMILVERIIKKISVKKIAAHFHDTYGQALANIFSVIQLGVATIDTSVGGLGGCPYAKGAKGNVATEDVLFMLEGMKIKTDINFKKVKTASEYIHKYMNKTPASRVAINNI